MTYQSKLEQFKFLFNEISIKELIDRINLFKDSVSIRDSSEQNIKNELNKIFTVTHKNKDFSFFLNNDIITPPHQKTCFYRIRKFTKEDINGLHSKVFPSIQKKQHILCRSKEDINDTGRLHGPKKQILYISSEITNAIYETECIFNDYFFLIVYTNKSELRLSQIQNTPYIDVLNEIENAKRIIMHQFLYNEFTKYVPKGREYEYISSRIIYEEYFWNPSIDGFCYPSIASPCNRGYNLCFTQEKAEEKLENIVVRVCKLLPSNGDGEFKIELYYDGFINDDDSFTFYKCNSEEASRKLGNYRFFLQF